MPIKQLIINPGSTSTKLAVYEDERKILKNWRLSRHCRIRCRTGQNWSRVFCPNTESVSISSPE